MYYEAEKQVSAPFYWLLDVNKVCKKVNADPLI